MKKSFVLIAILVSVILSLAQTGCPIPVNENVKEGTNLGLSEAVHAKDRALDVSVISNIETDFTLDWYAKTYGITVEVSHSVATVHMKVKTEEQRDMALELAKATKNISEVVDNIVVDGSLDDPPFEI